MTFRFAIAPAPLPATLLATALLAACAGARNGPGQIGASEPQARGDARALPAAPGYRPGQAVPGSADGALPAVGDVGGSAGEWSDTGADSQGLAAAGRGRHSAERAALPTDAQPGYALYTVILFGQEPDVISTTIPDSRQELLRVIETYVVDAGGDRAGARGRLHAFLLPVDRRRATDLFLRRPGPSGGAREAFAAYLQGQGYDALAARLRTRPGPFLVSSLEPVLIPSDPSAPAMLVDLTAVGPGYMYSVVDAYDRSVGSDIAGRAESLVPIRDRLMAMFPDGDPGGGHAVPASNWVFMLGRRQGSAAIDKHAEH